MSDKDYIKTLEESNKNLNAEIDRLRRMLSSHGINPDKELDKMTDEAYSNGYENHYNRYINQQIQIERRKLIQEQIAEGVISELDKKVMEDIWRLANSKHSPYSPGMDANGD